MGVVDGLGTCQTTDPPTPHPQPLPPPSHPFEMQHERRYLPILGHDFGAGALTYHATINCKLRRNAR